MLDAEEEAAAEEEPAGALLTGEDVVGAVVVEAPAPVGAGADVAATVELLVGIVGACGCPLTVLVTGAIVV